MRAILTPLDGSRLAEESLRAACATARRTGAVLHMVLVHHPVAPNADSAAMATAIDELDRLAREGEERYLEQIAERMQSAYGIHVETAILDGPVAETIGAHVRQVGAGLVVMTTHGRGVVSRFWLGSVADHLLRHLDVPLLLLRHHETQVHDSRMAFRRMLIPLDGSERAEAVIEPALVLCPPPTAEIALMRVVPPAEDGLGGGPGRGGGLSGRGGRSAGAAGLPGEHHGGGLGQPGAGHPRPGAAGGDRLHRDGHAGGLRGQAAGAGECHGQGGAGGRRAGAGASPARRRGLTPGIPLPWPATRGRIRALGSERGDSRSADSGSGASQGNSRRNSGVGRGRVRMMGNLERGR